MKGKNLDLKLFPQLGRKVFKKMLTLTISYPAGEALLELN